MYNLNYAQTTLGVQSWREITVYVGVHEQKKVEYHCSTSLKRSCLKFNCSANYSSKLGETWHVVPSVYSLDSQHKT
jgi:hypothetical protein